MCGNPSSTLPPLLSLSLSLSLSLPLSLSESWMSKLSSYSHYHCSRPPTHFTGALGWCHDSLCSLFARREILREISASLLSGDHLDRRAAALHPNLFNRRKKTWFCQTGLLKARGSHSKEGGVSLCRICTYKQVFATCSSRMGKAGHYLSIKHKSQWWQWWINVKPNPIYVCSSWSLPKTLCVHRGVTMGLIVPGDLCVTMPSNKALP